MERCQRGLVVCVPNGAQADDDLALVDDVRVVELVLIYQAVHPEDLARKVLAPEDLGVQHGLER